MSVPYAICECGFIGDSSEFYGYRYSSYDGKLMVRSGECPVCYNKSGPVSVDFGKRWRWMLAHAGTAPQLFISAIMDDPSDDAPRLIYADWLDENGGKEIAERIRSKINKDCNERK